MSTIQFISQPQNLTVDVGETAVFHCDYEGTVELPFWYIGGSAYSVSGLPNRHSYRNRVLSVRDVQMMDTTTTYQCSFIKPESTKATLTVIPGGK